MSMRNLVAGLILIAAVAGTGAFAATDVCCRGPWDPKRVDDDVWRPDVMSPGQRQRMLRHWVFMNYGLPEAYRGARNPLLASVETIAAGAETYRAYCQECHGPRGLGDGDAAKSLAPSPAVLARIVEDPTAIDGYLMWAISDGGDAFESDMPAYKALLTEAEIWRIVAYMRAGFPD